VSRFKPVTEPVYTDGHVSQTVLRKYNLCPRSAYLALRYKGQETGHNLAAGTALHLIIERAVRLCIEHNEATVPPEIVKAIAGEVLGEIPVPIEEHDRIREMAYRWAEQTAVPPNGVIACESLFTIDVDGFQVRCRIDYAETVEGGIVAVRDWKSSRAAPSYEEISRKRPDGTVAAKAFQLVLYGLALRYGHPVREDPCPQCGGKGYREIPNPGGPRDGEDCDECLGKGVAETVEPFVLCGSDREFRLSYVFPAIETSDGRMLERGTTLTPLELDEYMESLRGLVARLRASESSGDWPAQVSDAGCSECPAPSQCPIPKELRIGSIESIEQAGSTMEIVDRMEAVIKDAKKAVKAYSKSNEVSIPFGVDKVYGPEYMEQERIADKDGLFEALASGRQVDRSEFVKVVKSTPYRVRTLTVDEQAEGSNGR
jgi:hypothetical protein